MDAVIAWVLAIAGVVAAVAGVALWLSERRNSKTLRRQQEILEQQLAEAREARSESKAVDLRILALTSGGGGGGYLDFNAELANYGTRPCRCYVDAEVGGERVECGPATLDLGAKSAPSLVRVIVPRPRLGELMPECNNEATLYGQTLVIRVSSGDIAVEETWREPVYDAETHRERHEIQQRYWRRGRGEETEADLRDEWRAERERRLIERQQQEGADYEW